MIGVNGPTSASALYRAWQCAFLMVTVLMVAGCFSKPAPQCAFLCADDGSCPSGYTCSAVDNWCKREGVAPDHDCDPGRADAASEPDASVANDAAEVDAAEVDAAEVDAAEVDAAEVDAAEVDAAGFDAAADDATTMDDAAMDDAAMDDAAMDDAATVDASMPDADLTPTCANYCAAFEAACTNAATDEFASSAACESYCTTNAIPMGNPEDSSGNTIGCRTTHAGLAPGNQTVHCPHAGQTGGNVCGTWCENYCHLAATRCTGGNQITFAVDCMTDCSAMTVGAGAPLAEADTDTVQCRIQQLAVVPTANCAAAAPTDTSVCSN